MTDEPNLEDELAKLTPEQRQQVEMQALLQTPVRLPIAFGVFPLASDGGEPFVLLGVQTPAGKQVFVLTRDEALALASQLRKVAQTGPGPSLVVPNGLVVPK